MKVIICDDEKSTCAELENIILEYASEKGIQIDVDVFFSGDTLRQYLGNGDKPNLLFLDIELPGMDGVGVGEFIREELEEEQIFIVYISSKESYALQLFKNRPFDFMIKPLKRGAVFKVLDNILKLLQKENYYFQFQNKKTLYRIPYKDILYFQSVGKKVNIVMFNEIKSFYGKLSEVKLKESYFLDIHKSYLINYNYVSEYTYEEVKMINGHILNISKANRATVRKKILERERNDLRSS